MQSLLSQYYMTKYPPPPLVNYPFSIPLLQDYLLFLRFLRFPPTFRPLEMLAADFKIPPASASWESAALWFE